MTSAPSRMPLPDARDSKVFISSRDPEVSLLHRDPEMFIPSRDREGAVVKYNAVLHITPNFPALPWRFRTRGIRAVALWRRSRRVNLLRAAAQLFPAPGAATRLVMTMVRHAG